VVDKEEAEKEVETERLQKDTKDRGGDTHPMEIISLEVSNVRWRHIYIRQWFGNGTLDTIPTE
jgi:hypothetical protein